VNPLMGILTPVHLSHTLPRTGDRDKTAIRSSSQHHLNCRSSLEVAQLKPRADELVSC
jgi:hypothetical protein